MLALLLTVTKTQIGVAQVLALVAALLFFVTIAVALFRKVWDLPCYLILCLALALLALAVLFGLPGGTG